MMNDTPKMVRLQVIAAIALLPDMQFTHHSQKSDVLRVLACKPKLRSGTTSTCEVTYQNDASGQRGTLELPSNTPIRLSRPLTNLNLAYSPLERACLLLLESVNATGGILVDEQGNACGLASDPEQYDLAVDADYLCYVLQQEDVREACLIRQPAAETFPEDDDPEPDNDYAE